MCYNKMSITTGNKYCELLDSEVYTYVIKCIAHSLQDNVTALYPEQNWYDEWFNLLEVRLSGEHKLTFVVTRDDELLIIPVYLALEFDQVKRLFVAINGTQMLYEQTVCKINYDGINLKISIQAY